MVVSTWNPFSSESVREQEKPKCSRSFFFQTGISTSSSTQCPLGDCINIWLVKLFLRLSDEDPVQPAETPYRSVKEILQCTYLSECRHDLLILVELQINEVTDN